MSKQALKAIEIEVLSRSTYAPASGASQSLDRGDDPSKPETRGRAALRWFVGALAFAGAGMAGVYIGVWLDPPNVSGDQTGRKDGPDWSG